MEKYIEEQEILWRMNNALDEQDTYLPIHFKEMVIDECNPSDVVERSKIEQAKAEIEKLSGQTCYCSDGIVDEVLEILEKI